MCKDYMDVLKRAHDKLLQGARFDIVFCTCNEAAGMRVGEHISPRQCIIDECGMAHEPETIVPIGLCEHAVLIGDHKQLQPVIGYHPARENGLTTSLFERYAECRGGEQFVQKLKKQYRMVSTISVSVMAF